MTTTVRPGVTAGPHPVPGALTAPVLPPALLGAAALVGLACVALGSWLLLRPTSTLAQDPEVFLVRSFLGPRPTGVLLAALGLAGALGAFLGLAARARRRSLLALAVVELLGCGGALQSVTTMSLAGYLLAAALLPALVVLAVLVVRRSPVLRWPVLVALLGAVVAVVAAWPAVSGALVRLGRQLATGVVAAAPGLAVTVVMGAAVAAWALVAVRLTRGSSTARAAGTWVVRHRLALTLVAAAGPLPYGLVRMTWLTPWPLFAPGGSLPGEVRLWGLLLGGAALTGTVLTLGLVLPWGERFPRWFPGRAGRPVPVAAAVVPGGLVAGLVCAAALPMLRLALLPTPDEVGGGLPPLVRLEMAGVFPFSVWGPALALAVWAYARHRTGGRG